MEDAESCSRSMARSSVFASGDQMTIFFSGIQREIRPNSRRISSCDVPSPR
jgi:hypothetical protein